MKPYILVPLMLLQAVGFAQTASPNQAGVSMGHLHLNAKDADAEKQFWGGFLGAKPTKLGNMEVLMLPGTIVFINPKEPSAGSEGSVVNHVGVKVRNLQEALAKAQASRVQVVSSNAQQAMLVSPGGTRVELTEDTTLSSPVVNHHIHFYTPDIEATRKWYVSMFGAVPGMRGKFLAADLPGVNLSFSEAGTALAGTRGRALDHIGFEVVNLEDFCHKLEAKGVHFDVPYRSLPNLGVAIAFFTDPWGTYIELTEGLSKIR